MVSGSDSESKKSSKKQAVSEEDSDSDDDTSPATFEIGIKEKKKNIKFFANLRYESERLFTISLDFFNQFVCFICRIVFRPIAAHRWFERCGSVQERTQY